MDSSSSHKEEQSRLSQKTVVFKTRQLQAIKAERPAQETMKIPITLYVPIRFDSMLGHRD